MQFPKKLSEKLEVRRQNNAFRELYPQNNLIDFSSNDYLGFAKSEVIFKETHQYLINNNIICNGATGSRSLTGNHEIYQIAETFIAKFHQSQTALIFNSGYNANVGFFGFVPQKGDFILYDELCHASIRDGILMSNAKSYKFNHNDFEDLEALIIRCQTELVEVYVVTETVFSMDGDVPHLQELVTLCEKYNCHLVLDEAHALGVIGENGKGLIQDLQLQNKIFARIITFGKALGCHGAAILGSNELRDYLINFSRSFIYTTALSPHAVAMILIAYQHLEKNKAAVKKLQENILFFNQQKNILGLKPVFIKSKSAIQSAIIPGNEKVKTIAHQITNKGFDVKAILSPTVPIGQERLRFCLHNYNSESEMIGLLQLFYTFF